MSGVKGRGACDPQCVITTIWVFKYGDSHPTSVEHDNNESTNFIESYFVSFGISGPSNLMEMMSVIGMEDMVPGTRLRHTQY